MEHMSKTMTLLLVKENKLIQPLSCSNSLLCWTISFTSLPHLWPPLMALTCTAVAQISPLSLNPICSTAYLGIYSRISQKHIQHMPKTELKTPSPLLREIFPNFPEQAKPAQSVDAFSVWPTPLSALDTNARLHLFVYYLIYFCIPRYTATP